MRMNSFGRMGLKLAITCVSCTMVFFAIAQDEKAGDRKGAPVPTQAARKGFHVLQGVGYIAVNNDAALQDMLSRTLGVTLVTDKNERISGLLAMSKKGGVLAEKKFPYGSDPGKIYLVSIAGDDGWWREPDADNAVVLIEMLNNDKDSRWREGAACALGGVGTPTAIKALETALKKDSDEGVRAAAKEAIKRASTTK
jgi:hypothetical protein